MQSMPHTANLVLSSMYTYRSKGCAWLDDEPPCAPALNAGDQGQCHAHAPPRFRPQTGLLVKGWAIWRSIMPADHS